MYVFHVNFSLCLGAESFVNYLIGLWKVRDDLDQDFVIYKLATGEILYSYLSFEIETTLHGFS